MNRNLLSAAVSAACLTMAGTAAAIPLQNYVAGTDTLEIRISGASAQDLALEKALAGVCVANTLDGATQLNNSVYYCSIAPGTAPNPAVSTLPTFVGVPASVNKLVVYKSSVGGSGNGVAPVATMVATSPGNLTFLNLAAIAGNTTAAYGTNPLRTVTSAALPAYTMADLAVLTNTALGVSDVGLSDVEPSLLGASLAVQGQLTRFEGGHLTFGIPVTLTLRNQLQDVQFPALVGLGATDPLRELAANQPDISTPQLSAMMNGSSQDFTALGIAAGGVHMALRSATSGTTRVNNAYFGTDTGQCILGARGRKTQTDAASTGATLCQTVSVGEAATGKVVWGSGSDNVLTCLANHEAAGRRAFGILSMETSTVVGGATSTTSSGAVRFIKIDGDLPTLLNVANGRYGLWASVSYQYRGGTSTFPLSTFPDRLAGAESLRAYLGNKEVLGDVNLTIAQTWGAPGDVGYLAAPSGTNAPPPLPVTSLAANLTNPYTKVNGGVQNNCHRGIKF